MPPCILHCLTTGKLLLINHSQLAMAWRLEWIKKYADPGSLPSITSAEFSGQFWMRYWIIPTHEYKLGPYIPLCISLADSYSEVCLLLDLEVTKKDDKWRHFQWARWVCSVQCYLMYFHLADDKHTAGKVGSRSRMGGLVNRWGYDYCQICIPVVRQFHTNVLHYIYR